MANTNLNWTTKANDVDDVLAEDFNNLVTNIETEFNGKVSKESGKGLIDTNVADNISIKNYGTNDVFTVETPETDFKFVNAEKVNVPTAEDIQWGTDTTLQAELDKKVDTVTGKGLSANDYTDTEKEEVAKIKDKVGFTDYATADKAGIVKADDDGSIHGVAIDPVTHVLYLDWASETQIDDRAKISCPCPIVPDNLDYAVRSVRPKVSGTIPDTLAVNTIYAPETITSALDLTLPIGEHGDFIQVDFISGTTPTNLSITSAFGLGYSDFVPEADTVYSLYFDWGIIYSDNSTVINGWRFGYAAYPHEEV